MNQSAGTNSLLPFTSDAEKYVCPAFMKRRGQIKVPSLTIDSYCRKRGIREIDILKLDIQGSEHKALEGARRLLEQSRIAMIFTEVWFVEAYEGAPTFQVIQEYLSRLGCSLHDLCHPVYTDTGRLKWADAIFLSRDFASHLDSLSAKRDPVIVLSAPGMKGKSYFTAPDMAVDDMGLGYLYSALANKGYTVHLIDPIHDPCGIKEQVEQIARLGPAYVGLSGTVADFDRVLVLSAALKRRIHGVRIICGDIHASLYAEDILRNEPNIDYVVWGDGCKSLPLLIRTLEENGDRGLVPGLVYREGQDIRTVPPRADPNLDSLPFPHRTSLGDLRPNSHLTFSVSTSRGCPGHCTFCSIAALSNERERYGLSRWRSRSPESIFGEMRFLYDRGARKFWFCDDNWIGPRDSGLENAQTLCHLLLDSEMDISFSALIRPDSLLPSDRPTLELMRSAGLCMLFIGLEAGNDEQLKLYGKHYDPEAVKELILLIHELQINIAPAFIMFFPYSTISTLRQNVRYLSSTGLAHCYSTYHRALSGFSRIGIEKLLQTDGLVLEPTTYKSRGVYRFADPAIAAVLETVSIFKSKNMQRLIRAGGHEASRRAAKGLGSFQEYRQCAARLGRASEELFLFCLDQHEAGLPADRIRSSVEGQSEGWLKVVEQERTILESFLPRRRGDPCAINATVHQG